VRGVGSVNVAVWQSFLRVRIKVIVSKVPEINVPTTEIEYVPAGVVESQFTSSLEASYVMVASEGVEVSPINVDTLQKLVLEASFLILKAIACVLVLSKNTSYSKSETAVPAIVGVFNPQYSLLSVMVDEIIIDPSKTLVL
jgi:hypothetical protein